MDLVRFGMDSTELARKVKDVGIEFEPTDDFLEALRKAGAQDIVIQAIREVKPLPLTREQVGKLVAGGLPNERSAMLVKRRGIGFIADDQYLETLRVAGADDALIAALREASAAPAELMVETSPNAEIFLDGQPQGYTHGQGELTIKVKAGTHTLGVLLKGKKDFQRIITLSPLQVATIKAVLVGAPLAETTQVNLSSELWHSEASQHDFRVELSKDLFRAEWVNIPPDAAMRGAYIHTECRRAGLKWVGSSNVNMLFRVPGAIKRNHVKLCSFTVRFEIDSITATRITGHSEAVHAFDVKSCRVQRTSWGEFTWVPKN